MPPRTVAGLMARPVVTLSPDSDIVQAIRTLLRYRISAAPVVGPEGRLVGMLSEKDCLRVLAGEALEGRPEGKVRDYMTTSVETVRPTTSLYDIVDLLLNNHFRQMPVVDDEGHVVGEVSRRHALVAIESIRDNSYLYGTEEHHPVEEPGVASAMWVARGQR